MNCFMYNERLERFRVGEMSYVSYLWTGKCPGEDVQGKRLGGMFVSPASLKFCNVINVSTNQPLKIVNNNT